MELVSPLALFKGKRVLVTGHTGFKGSWLSFWLNELGAKVSGFSLEPQSDNLFHRLKLSESMHSIIGDIRNMSQLSQALAETQPEIVLHLAAQAIVGTAYNEPRETFETNVQGTVNLLEAVRQTKAVRSLVCVTTDKCYRNKDWIWGYRENDELGGDDPYSASKAAAEIAVESYTKSFFQNSNHVGVATARAGNVIGGGDWSSFRLIPDCIRALERGEPIILRSPSYIRPWQHVLEPLYGYLKLAGSLYSQPKAFSGGWNFGPSVESLKTVEEVSNLLVEFWGRGQIAVSESSAPFKEARTLHLNSDKARQLLQWNPSWQLERALEMTVKWYQHASLGVDLQEFTRSQIEEYVNDNETTFSNLSRKARAVDNSAVEFGN